MANQVKLRKSKFAGELQMAVEACEAIRRDTEDPQDITLGEYFHSKNNISMEGLYEDLGINPNVDTIQNLVNVPDKALRWLIPEIFRDALRLGMRKNPIYPALISGEQSVKQTSITMPAINMSDAQPFRVGVGETIKFGDVSFDSKMVSIYKMGRGIKVPYEVIQYVSLNLVALFLQDFGVKLGMGISAMAIDTLINGDQPGGTDSASVIGIGTVNSLTYKDLLTIWVRGGRMQKNFNTMVSGENAAIDILNLLTNTRVFGQSRTQITVKSPIPNNADVYIHGNIPTSQTLILDTSDALIKLNAQPLLVETEKLIANQTEQTFATLTTGFATVFSDSRLILDTSKAFGSYGFPSYMDPSTEENVVI